MSNYLKSSTEFLALSKQLQQSPESPENLKKALLTRLPSMKQLAKTNPMAQYCLAKLHPENSSQYAQMMRQSAEAGCANAMLAMAKLLVRTDNTEEAVEYVRKINASDDTYIKRCAQDLLAEYPSLSIANKTTASVHRFFQGKVCAYETAPDQALPNLLIK